MLSTLTETIFICPDAPEKCAASPTGFQWFDLMDQTPEQILSKSLVAENKLNKMIDEIKEKYNLLKLEHDYLTSPNKLIEYQKLYFDGELKTLDIEKIGKIYIDQDGYKIEKFNFSKK